MPAMSSSPLTRPANFVAGSSTTATMSRSIVGGNAAHEAKRPVAHWGEVERRTTHLGALYRLEKMLRQDGQLAEHKWKSRRRLKKTDGHGAVIRRGHRLDRGEIARTQVARSGIPSCLKGEMHVMRCRGAAVMPPKRIVQVKRERAPVS